MKISERIRRAAHRRIGRRGGKLLALGVADIIYGISLTAPNGSAQNATIRWFAQLGLPLWFWSLLWIGVGLSLLVGAFRKADLWAFLTAILIKCWWVILCFAGWLADQVSLGAPGLFFGIAVTVMIDAGWPEPPDLDENAS